MSAEAKGSSWGKRIGIAVGVLVVVILVAAGTVFAVSSSGMSKKYDVQPAPLDVKPTAELAEKGKELATFRGCRDCHGEDLAGRQVADAMPVMVLSGPNITPGGVVKGYTDEDWARSIRHGVKPDGTPLKFMPSYEYTELSHGDLAAIIAYAKSVKPVDGPGPAFKVGPLGRILYVAGELPLIPAEMVNHEAKPANPTPGPTAEYGKYLSTGCIGCHGNGLSGGPIPGVPPDWPTAANLTMHDSGLAAWTFEDFKTTLRTGTNPSGKKLKQEYMPWQYVAQSPDRDLKALWEYLQTVEKKPIGGR